MTEPRLLCFHDPAMASLWQRVLDEAGLDAQCIVYDEPFKDERGYWQPPRWHWYDITVKGVLKHVYAIDGGWYRDNIDANFDGGGNHGAYDNIPVDCEYVEANNDEDQHDAKIIANDHEAPEDVDLANDPQRNYEEWHGHAITTERAAREPFRDPRVIADPSRPLEDNEAAADSPSMSALVDVIRERRGR